MKTKTDQEVLTYMRKDALYAYLEFCNAANEVPRKDVYDDLVRCENGELLDRLICMIENGQSEIERSKEKSKLKSQESFFKQILNFFK